MMNSLLQLLYPEHMLCQTYFELINSIVRMDNNLLAYDDFGPTDLE